MHMLSGNPDRRQNHKNTLIHNCIQRYIFYNNFNSGFCLLFSHKRNEMDNHPLYHALAQQGFIPVRREPFERAEMVTQVLFGEFVKILDEEGPWLFINALTDGYEGWIDRAGITRVDTISDHPCIVARRNIRIRNLTTGAPVILPIGSRIPETEDNLFSMAGENYRVDDPEQLLRPGETNPAILFEELLSVPYLWGGRCGFGFDCSGLTQFLCRVAGREVPRDAAEQSAMGETLSFISESKTGDLAFFDNAEGMINHVGMIADSEHIIHASGMVRMDRIDQQGIFNEKIGKYTHKLRVLKRIV